MITITEEPYDSDDAKTLVAALNVEIEVRYAYDVVGWSDEERAADVAGYVAEVTPDRVRAPHGTFVVARLDGEAIACGAVKELDDEGRRALRGVSADGRIGEVKRMYTAPVARRRGASRAVLAHLERRAVELGYACLVLETGTAQPEALALYASAGWREISSYGRYRDSPDSVCFAKDLSGGGVGGVARAR